MHQLPVILSHLTSRLKYRGLQMRLYIPIFHFVRQSPEYSSQPHTPKYNKRILIKIFLKITPKKAGVHTTYPQPPYNHFTHSIEIAKEQGANKLLNNCPSCIISLKKGLELMQEAGEPM